MCSASFWSFMSDYPLIAVIAIICITGIIISLIEAFKR